MGPGAIELGSDLQEVQNVVDVTFPRMSKAGGYVCTGCGGILWPVGDHGEEVYGNFGAMAKAFGFNERAAYEMSTALTGLAGVWHPFTISARMKPIPS